MARRRSCTALVTGLGAHRLATVSVLLAGCVILAGCGTLGGARVDPVGEVPWGAAMQAASEGNIVLGSQPWCSRSGDPVTVDGVEWEALDGLRVVDFAVVSQDATAERTGMLYGSLPQVVPDSRDARTISSACSDVTGDGLGSTASYVVLEVELTDPSTVGAARGLRLSGDLTSGVEPLTVIVCPADAPSCDKNDAPAGITSP